MRVDASTATVRRQFDCRAARFPRHDALVREVGARMIERLSYMRQPVSRLLDLGCGQAGCRVALEGRFPGALWLGVDLSWRMLHDSVPPSSWGARLAAWLGAPSGATGRGLRICASAERLPLADASIDLVFCNLMLHWHPAPHEAIAEIARVLRTGGLIIFSSYGPDTWLELRAGCTAELADARPMPYVDMHDYGDMLVAAGFEAPVMEVEMLQLTYGSGRQLLAEARALGGNPRADRARGLPSGRRARALIDRLQRGADAQGRLGLRFEIVVGHGWKAPVREPGTSTIAMPRPRGR